MSVGDETELRALAILLKEGRIADPVPAYGKALERAVGEAGARLAWNERPLPKRATR